MNHFDYIEHVINEPASSRIRLRFSAGLINDPELRYEYHRYIELSEVVEEQQNILMELIENLTDFTFSADIACSIPDIKDDMYKISTTNEDSVIIRKVIEANRPRKSGESKGWFKAAASLSLMLLFINSGIAIITDVIECFRTLITGI